MKRILSVLIITICSVAFSQEKKPDFRDSNWGCLMNEVEESEGMSLEKVRDFYLAKKKINISDYYAYPIYIFLEEKLACGGYLFEIASNDAFDSIDEALDKKYGKAEYNDERFYKNGRNLFQDFSTQYKLGNLYYESKWNSENSIIFHRQEVINKVALHRVIYCMPAIKEELSKLLEKSQKEDAEDGNL